MTEVLHSRYGGSSAPRWMNCAGSVALLATIPSRPSGVAALIGTAAHALAEACLKNALPAEHYRGSFFPTPEDEPDRNKRFIAEDGMVAAVQTYLDAVNAEMALTPDAELYVEQGFVLDIPGADPGEVFGTNDAMVYHPTLKRLRVFDYKHGFQDVDADDNAQLKFYAAGAVFSNPDWKLAEIVLTIVQPNARSADEAGAVKDWTFDVVELLEFQGDVEKAIARAKAVAATPRDHPLWPTDALNPGPWCDKTWCDAKAAGKCPAVDRMAVDKAGLDFAGVKVASVADVTPQLLPDPKTLDGARLARVVAGLDAISTWQSKCQEYLEAMVLGGHEVPGWKAVEKLGRARWVDDPTQVVAYADLMFGVDPAQMMPPKIVTITEAEKLLKAAGAKKDDLDAFKLKFTVKESSGLTIAPASDRRPAVNAVAADFGGVNTAALIAAE